MKRRLFSIFLATLAVGLIGSCAKINEQIADLDKRVETIETQNIVSINTQIESINSSIADLGQIRKDIQDLIGTNTSQNADIKALQTADENIGKRIDELKAYVGDLSRFAEENWVKNTFATIDELNKTAKELDDLAKTVDGISKNLENLGKTVDGLGKSLEELSGKLSKDIKDASDKLAAQIKSLEDRVSALEQMIQTVTIVPAYTDGSVEAVDDVLTIDCVIEPAAALETLTEKNIFILSSTAKTKAVSIDTIKVAKFGKDIEKGIITIKADVSEVAPASGEALVVAVKIVNGISQYTTEFAPVATVSTGLPKGSLGGEFSVSSTKKVHFSKSNLYYDGAAFQFEANQFDYVKAWDKSHVGLFYWSKDAAAATAANYSDPQASAGDVLFTNAAEFTINNAVEGFRTLTKQEWVYLTEDRNNAELLCKAGVTVCGNKNCMVIAPDDFKGTISESYNSDEWFMAEEAGLVCLPAAGIRSGSSLAGAEDINTYWTATPTGVGAAGNVVFEAEAEPETKALACAANGKGIADLEINDFNGASRVVSLGSSNLPSDLKFGNQNAQQSNKGVAPALKDNNQNVTVKKMAVKYHDKAQRAQLHQQSANVASVRTLQATNGDLIITSSNVDDSYVASDGEWDIYLYTNIGGVDVVVGLYGYNETLEGTYDLATNMNEYSCVFDAASFGWDFYEEFTACNFTVTSLGDNEYSCAGSFSIASGDFTFSTTLSYTPYVPQVYTLTASNFTDDYYYGRMVNFTTEIGYFSFLINAEELESGKTYGWDDIDHTSTRSCYSKDGYYVTSGYTDADLTKTAGDDGSFTVVAHASLTNGDQVTINYAYEKPDTKEININVANATLTNKLTAGFWSISGQTADKNNSFNIYFISKGLQGIWTDVKKFDSYSTWVSDKSSGSNVYYENISAVNLTSAIVKDSLIVEGTLALADSKGNPATVTVHISTPFEQTWGEWADFAPFDKNTGKYTFATFGAYTQAGIEVQERKDNTGLKQYKLKNWSKGYFDGVGQDLILNMNPDHTFTFASNPINLGADVYFADVATAYNNPAYASLNSYDPETGVFNFYTAVVFASNGNVYTAEKESLVMDKTILQRDTVDIVSTAFAYNDLIATNGVTIYYAADVEGYYLFRVTSNKATAVEGTFKWSDGTINDPNSYFSVKGSDKNYFQDGEFTVATEGRNITLKGWMIGTDEKYYRLNWSRRTDVLDYDTNAPFDAEFVIANDASIYLENGEIGIYATNAENLTIGLTLFTDPANTEIPAGTYVISDSQEAGTALKSIGVYGGYLTECFAGVRTAQGISDCWFLVEGTVTITYDENGEMSVEVDAKNSWEQNVTARFVPGLNRNYALPIRLVSEAVK